MANLMPTLKEKKRYVVYEISSDKPMGVDSKKVVEKVQSIMGVFDSAKAGLMNAHYNQKTQRGVIRVTTKYVDKLRTSLMLIEDIDNEDVSIRTIGVSGILQKAKHIAG